MASIWHAPDRYTSTIGRAQLSTHQRPLAACHRCAVERLARSLMPPASSMRRRRNLPCPLNLSLLPIGATLMSFLPQLLSDEALKRMASALDPRCRITR